MSNRSRKYLAQLLNKTFSRDALASLYIEGVYIGDRHPGYNGSWDYLFILIDSFKTDNFQDKIDVVRQDSNYVIDYVVEVTLFSEHHMLVLGLPEDYNGIVNKFLRGRYDQMYKPEDIELLFVKAGEMETARVLRNDKDCQTAINFADSLGVSQELLPQCDSVPKLNEEVYRFAEDEFLFKDKFHILT